MLAKMGEPMAKLLIRTNGAELQEIEGMQNLLNEHAIVNYLTESGRWRIGLDALWIANDEDWPQAQALVQTFQEDYAALARQATADISPRDKSFYAKFYAAPGMVLMSVIALLIVLGVSLLPFIWF